MDAEGVKYADQFRQALERGDAAELWRIWAHAFPNMPGPKTYAQAEIVMHRARTEARSMPLKVRAYSHSWLCERGIPSALPDNLRPKAERMYPRIVAAVGIAVKVPAIIAPVGLAVQKAMSDAVLELQADGVALDNRPLVHARMFEARERTLNKLLGTTELSRVT